MMEERFPILKVMKWDHLPPHLQEISRPFCELARRVAESAGESRLSGMETATALRKLREAKDCAVTAALGD
jgi:hypothetical protein